MASPIAETLAAGQKEISVAEFFERNRQILGFDSPTKALITSVKEAVDNALDACEEAGILPDIRVEIRPGEHEGDLCLIVDDNGPGIVPRQMPNIFARLLYGSRFHAIRQSRGQQGIGISAVVLYGQTTTGNKATVVSKIGEGHPAVKMQIGIDVKRNLPDVANKEMVEDFDRPNGTHVEVMMKARYQQGRQSVLEYLRGTSIVNPHAKITFVDPTGNVYLFDRAAEELPLPTVAIKPHPRGIELGQLLKLAQQSEHKRFSTFLQKDFSSVGADSAKKLLAHAGLDNKPPQELTMQEARRLMKAFDEVKILNPPTDCLSPIGETLVRRSLKKETADVSPEFITTVTRPPSVWGGHPFQVEVGIVYGGSLPKDSGVRILRFANRVPLIYQQGACEGTLGVQDVDWRRYGLEQRGGKGIPNGPAIIMVHVASTKVPFTSEAKEAIAPMEEIHKEIRLALMDAARGLGRHLKKKDRRAKVSEKFTLVQKILPEIAKKSSSMLGKPEPDLAPIVCKIMDVIWIEDSQATYEKIGTITPAPIVRPAMTSGGYTLDHFGEQEKAEALADGEPEEATEEVVVEQKPKTIYEGKATMTLVNYKQDAGAFKLYAVLPEGGEITKILPEPSKKTDRWVQWEIRFKKPAESITVEIDMKGIGKGDLDNLDTFVSGINELHVVGADTWHGGEA